MSTVKTNIDGQVVVDFLHTQYDKTITAFTKITGGELSQAFSYTVNDEDFVIRINKSNKGFLKDKYASEHFISPVIPIPKTYAIGQLNDIFYFSITEKMPGRTLDQCTESDSLVHSVLITLDAIHQTPISGVKFGDWDVTGEASHNTWREYLLALLDENQRDIDAKNYADWFELSVVEDLTKIFLTMVDYCPEVRQLLHADFESGNTLSDGHKITGVIDWANAKYGDPIFDIAWIDFWKEAIDYKGAFKQYLKTQGHDIKNYDQRALCYLLYFGIGSLFFFAKSDQRSSYDWTKERLLRLVAEAR